MSQNPLFEMIPFRQNECFDLYLPKTIRPAPVICITPLLGRLALFEDLFLERRFAIFFARHGFGAALIHRPIFEFKDARGLEQLDEYLHTSIQRNKRIVDQVSALPGVCADKIGSFGMSFGAIVNCLWSAEDKRLKANVFALCGGNLPEIFIASKDPLMRSYLAASLQASGLTKHELKEELGKIFRRDPLKNAKSIEPGNTLLVLAMFDRVVPFRFGLALKHAIGNPQTIHLPLGHYLSILAVPILKRQALSFLRRKL